MLPTWQRSFPKSIRWGEPRTNSSNPKHFNRRCKRFLPKQSQPTRLRSDRSRRSRSVARTNRPFTMKTQAATATAPHASFWPEYCEREGFLRNAAFHEVMHWPAFLHMFELPVRALRAFRHDGALFVLTICTSSRTRCGSGIWSMLS